MYIAEELKKKWEPILAEAEAAPIKSRYKRAVTAVILENQEAFNRLGEEGMASRPAGVLTEAPATNNISGGQIAAYDPIMISMVRRALPQMIAFDICGVQPMTGPTGLIFAMRSRYVSQTGTESFFNEPNTAFSATNAAGANGNVSGSYSNTNPVLDLSDSTTYGAGFGMTTSNAEQLGTGAAASYFAEMAFSVDRVSVTARTRALKAEYSQELAQDLKALHGLDAETELSNILSTEILAEINREVVRTIYRSAFAGAQYGVTTAGTFDLDVDSNGRWLDEKFKGLYFQIERECNAIAKATRRGKGNILIVSADIASALAMTKILDYTPALQANLEVDDTGNTFAGTIHGKTKVYIDPYFGGSTNGDELVCVGYKGSSAYDAGLFYCPYVPLQMVRAVNTESFQPKIGFKTRYGMVSNPFATSAGDGVVGDRNNAAQANRYYRIFRVTHLM
jgi:hypothetical protein